MEIRRRRRRNKRRKRGFGMSAASGDYRRRSAARRTTDVGGLGGILLPIAVFGVVFYVVAFTALGDRLAQKAVGLLPDSCAERGAVSTFLPMLTEKPDIVSTDGPWMTGYDEKSSVKVILPRLSLYMLQMGVYSTKENAEEQAKALKQMGAAGYIYNDNGIYRVIASAYLNESDAQSVRDRLERDGYACTVFTVTCSGAELLITTDAQKLASIQKAFEWAGSIVDKVSAASLEFDTEERSAEYTAGIISELRLGAANSSAAIYDSAETNELLMYLYSFLNDSAEILGRAEAPSERVEYSSLLKEITMISALRYASLLKQICN